MADGETEIISECEMIKVRSVLLCPYITEIPIKINIGILKTFGAFTLPIHKVKWMFKILFAISVVVRDVQGLTNWMD